MSHVRWETGHVTTRAHFRSSLLNVTREIEFGWELFRQE